MNIFKYALIGCLVLSISKKIHLNDQDTKLRQNIFSLIQQNALASICDKCPPKPCKTEELKSTKDLESYNATTKTATLKDGSTFVGIIEYNQAVTPPNLSNPALKPFATIPTKNYQEPSRPMLGGRTATTTLYGIAVTGRRQYVKHNNKIIGFYWPQSRIVQLNNGDTFVAVIQEIKGNYKKKGAYAKGPVWTWFSESDLSKYGLSTTSPNFKKRVQTIGITQVPIEGVATLHQQFATLYGVLMQQAQSLSTPLSRAEILTSIAQRPMTSSNNNDSSESPTLATKNLAGAFQASLHHSQQPALPEITSTPGASDF